MYRFRCVEATEAVFIIITRKINRYENQENNTDS